jgi:hypothetical protein
MVVEFLGGQHLAGSVLRRWDLMLPRGGGGRAGAVRCGRRRILEETSVCLGGRGEGFCGREVDGLGSRGEVDGLGSRGEVDGLGSRVEVDGLGSRGEVDGLGSKGSDNLVAEKVGCRAGLPWRVRDG